jgi:hypothetical protein
MLRAYRSLIDLIGLGLAALVFLFPRPGASVRPVLTHAGARTLDRIAELQAHLARAPDDVDAALELSDIYIDQWRADWSLATLAPIAARKPNDHGLLFGLAVAHAERFDFTSAKTAIDQAQVACEHAPADCAEPDRVRMAIFDHAVGEVVAEHVNPLRDPNRTKQIIDSALHNTKIPHPDRAPLYLPPPPKPKPAAPR